MIKKILIIIIPIIIALFVFLSLPGELDDKAVKIAVMGNTKSFYTDFKLGIEQAIEDLNSEYGDLGFSFEYELYDDKNSYETGAAIIDRLNHDDTITAVVAPNNKELNRLAAYIFNGNDKLFLIPYALYDSVFSDNYYDSVFSLTYSKNKIGRIMRGAAAKTPAKRWVACIDNSELSMSELHGFIGEHADDNIKLVDCVSFKTLAEDMDENFHRWDILGVEGIMLLSDSAQFEEFKLIKKRFPDAQFILDSSFDDSEKILRDNELKPLLNKVIQSVDFTGYPHNDDDKVEFDVVKDMFREKHGKTFDLWYLHAYNMIRMIGDTAVKGNTSDPNKISKMLHADGYDGICEHYKFSENGNRTDSSTEYAIYADDGECYMKSLNER